MSRRSSILARRLALAGILLGGLALIALTSPSHAFRADPETDGLELVPSLDQTRYLYRAQELDQDPAVAAYSGRLQDQLGPGWSVTSWNQFSGTARSVQGTGIIVAPGGVASASASEVETIARAFIAEHAGLFATDGRDLVATKVAHGASRWGVIFEQRLGEVPIQGSQVVIAIHDNGRLFAFGSHLYPDVELSLSPTVEVAAAHAIARAAVPFDPTQELQPGPDALVIVPVHRSAGQVDYHLAHRTDVPTTQPLGVYRTWIDAHTGAILYRENQVEFAYEGSTSGDVEVFSPCDGDTPDTVMPNMTIDIDGVGTVDSDDKGNFSIAGNSGPHSYTAAFDGPDFNVNCSGCGGDALLNGTIEPDSPESVYFDAGSYRADERDAFHFANRTKLFIESIDPGFTQGQYTVNVNISGCCNANWNGTTMNFFRAGCGCENMARVSDVVAHEFGHGIQNWVLGGGQGPEGLGEGNSDISSTFITDNPIVGIGVNSCVSGARVCENNLMYPGDLTGQIHHDGQIICGFNWDVRVNLEPAMGFEGAKTHTASLWHFARRLYMNSSNNQPDQAERYLWVDDDDGDLTNGTPNFDAICMAMMSHGFQCPNITTAVDPDEEPAISSSLAFRLGDATPNPFNPSTTISYALARETAIQLSIRDVNGRLIRSLVDDLRPAGQHVATWDGTAEDGTGVSSGIYFYRLEAGGWSDTRAMVLAK
jgi:hypothetical protein